VVTLAELAARPIDITISSKHLTLIHFETGDVTMVAVGDPDIVNVTVKGPDVLLKALASTGSTNAFIWQAGRYTQWTFTVRQNTKDARLIIVKDLVAAPGDESTNKSTERKENNRKTTAEPGAAATSLPATGAMGNTSTPAAPAQAPLDVPSQQPIHTQATDSDACGKRLMLDQFVRTLNARQRELFGMFLMEPELPKAQALLRELTVQQRCDLVAFLSDPDHAAASSRAPPGTGTGASTAGAQPSSRGTPPAIQKPAKLEYEPPSRAAVALTVTPEIIDGQLFLYYQLANEGQATLLTDILRLRIFDSKRHRLAFRINRISRDGYVGRLETNGVEYGVIGVDGHEQVIALEWKLITLGSGVEQVVRIEAQVP
jgi:hypothetical protein